MSVPFAVDEVDERLAALDQFGIVSQRRADRRKYPPPPPTYYSGNVTAAVRRVVDAHIKAEVDRIVAQRTADIKRQLASAMSPGGPDVRQIILTVCDVTSTDLAGFLGPRRSRNYAYPRHFAAWLFKQCRGDLSFPAIALAMGGRDHTTIMHNIKVFERLRDQDPFPQWVDDPRTQVLLNWKADAQ